MTPHIHAFVSTRVGSFKNTFAMKWSLVHSYVPLFFSRDEISWEAGLLYGLFLGQHTSRDRLPSSYKVESSITDEGRLQTDLTAHLTQRGEEKDLRMRKTSIRPRVA